MPEALALPWRRFNGIISEMQNLDVLSLENFLELWLRAGQASVPALGGRDGLYLQVGS